MATHNDTGKKGELLAREWLEQQGFQVLEQNWRSGRDEIDMIASRNNTLHFFEVKTRRSRKHGYPEQSVTASKFTRMLRAAENYQLTLSRYWRIQYDVLAIELYPGREPVFELFKDVFLI